MKWFFQACCGIAFVLSTFGRAAAADAPAPAVAGAPGSYDAFVQGAKVTPGLISVAHKGGKVYLILLKSQLGQDFIETSVPSTGLGGFGPAPGEPYLSLIHI